MPTAGGSEYLEFDAVMSPSLPAFPLTTVGGPLTAAVWTHSYTPLRRRAPKVGENRPIDGVPGRLYVPREFDELPIGLTVRINGNLDTDGTPYEDRIEGARLNLEEFNQVIVDPDLARAVTFHAYGGWIYTGSVVVEDYAVEDVPNAAGDKFIGTLSMKLMASVLTLTDSGS